MKIQLITYNEREYTEYYKGMDISNFNNLKALDYYDINIIDLSSKDIWSNKSTSEETPQEIIKLTKDFISIKSMINNSQKTNIIICLPQNVSHRCESYGKIYWCQLKDYKSILIKILQQIIPIEGVIVDYENNITRIKEEKIESAFYFYEKYFKNLTRAEGSNKVTTVQNENIVFTTLNLISKKNIDIILNFLKQIGLNEDIVEFPKWLCDYEFNDDKQQKANIEKAKKEIEYQNRIIIESSKKIEQNMHFKSILVTQSDELNSVVFEILEYIFDISLKDFIDERKEDFLIKKEGLTYIGEIKGVTSNIRYENISQLEVHYSKYMDKLQDEGKSENIKKILIMNYERNKNISDRNEVNKMQIDLAVKNNTLIIDTKSLLMIYEKILKGKLKKEDVIDYISKTSGIIDIKELETTKEATNE